MKKFVMSIVISSLLLAGCSSEEMQSAISACNNDPSCALIVDDAIDEELTERGIEGGKMTVAEMDGVLDFLGQYSLVGDMKINLFQHLAQFYEYEGLEGLRDSAYFFVNLDAFQSKLFMLDIINTQYRQLFLQDSTKFIVYKAGANRFNIEISGDYILEATVDLDLNNLYVTNDEVHQLKIHTPSEIYDYFLSNSESLERVEVWGRSIVYKSQRRDGSGVAGPDFRFSQFEIIDVDNNVFSTIGLKSIGSFDSVDGIAYLVGFEINIHDYEASAERSAILNIKNDFVGTFKDLINFAFDSTNTYSVENPTQLTASETRAYLSDCLDEFNSTPVSIVFK